MLAGLYRLCSQEGTSKAGLYLTDGTMTIMDFLVLEREQW